MSDRDGGGRFVPGHAPLGGRPKGFRGVARQIMREGRDGAELVEFAYALLRDTSADMQHRLTALHWLSDRSLGKPMARHELEAHVSAVGSARLDIRALAAAVPAELVAAMAAALEAHPSLLLPAGEGEVDE